LIAVGSEWITLSLNDLTLLLLAFTWGDQQSLPITVLAGATTDLIVRIEAIGAHLHLTMKGMKGVTVPVAVGMIARVHALFLLVCKTMMRSIGREKFDTKLNWVQEQKTKEKLETMTD